MAATQIVAVNTSYELTTKGAGGGMHKHITEVKTADDRVLTRAEAVSKIKSGAESFCTKADGKEGSPRVTVGEFTRTSARVGV